MDPNLTVLHATSIVSVWREGRVVVPGDGQVTLGNTVMKANAHKVRRLKKSTERRGSRRLRRRRRAS